MAWLSGWINTVKFEIKVVLMFTCLDYIRTRDHCNKFSKENIYQYGIGIKVLVHNGKWFGGIVDYLFLWSVPQISTKYTRNYVKTDLVLAVCQFITFNSPVCNISEEVTRFRNRVGLILELHCLLWKKNLMVEFECESGWISWFSTMDTLSDVIDIIICLIKFIVEQYDEFYSFSVLYCCHEMAWKQYHWTRLYLLQTNIFAHAHSHHTHSPLHYIILWFLGVLPVC